MTQRRLGIQHLNNYPSHRYFSSQKFSLDLETIDCRRNSKKKKIRPKAEVEMAHRSPCIGHLSWRSLVLSCIQKSSQYRACGKLNEHYLHVYTRYYVGVRRTFTASCVEAAALIAAARLANVSAAAYRRRAATHMHALRATTSFEQIDRRGFSWCAQSSRHTECRRDKQQRR